ncbi:hypothetical protein MAR_029074 [Mya arenaria]|uniref:Uncharacterized protein n=1 Tax=Mya arenaria TaxID=6604 RepID=A0ABY7DGF8_MYAAR|nr:hypothetical protein MAR_029074 [Mya arenaria]
MELPGSNSDYREKSYWDERYTTEETYDCFTGYFFMSTIMYEDGFKLITNTDFLPVVIEKMAEKHKYLTEINCQVEHVLKPGAEFISIAFALSHFRRPLYARKHMAFDVNMSTIGEAFHFLYGVEKKETTQ